MSSSNATNAGGQRDLPELPSGDYTVGWICAITPEYVAAIALLDERHKRSDNSKHQYTLGKMAGHNVVIAVFPDGEYGTATAAATARNLLSTFPNITIGLMVGVGGGAPSEKHDIRLGDVIVSAPGNGEPGVFQYDYGRTIQNQAFQETQHLDKPPSVLREAVSAIKVAHEMYGHNIPNMITTAFDKVPRIKAKFSSPGPDLDKLYLSTVVHRFNDNSRCDISCGVKDSLFVFRRERREDEDDPFIHYGLIATANQVMKDATIRDRLAKERDVLCFEMESGGLMNHFPCLVVRGICDYADTHKNKDWQGYAAMTAAAYTKSLLEKIQPGSATEAEKLGDLLQDVLSSSHEAAAGISNLDTSLRHEKITEWLSPPDYRQNFSTAKGKHQSGTGQWLLDSEHYKSWKTDESSSLWLNGKTGCGKTILSYTVIADLEADKRTSDACLFFYFDFTDVKKQFTENALCSLIDQLYDKKDDTRAPLDKLFEKKVPNKDPDYYILNEVFQSMIKLCSQVWIVLDALDECSNRSKEKANGLLSWIEHLRCACSNVHIMFTSRPEPDIQESIDTWHNCNRILLQPGLVSDDITTYVHRRVARMKLWQNKPILQKLMRDTLIQGAKGMFRWVACQFDTLETCLSPGDVEDKLKNLPETLDATYAQMMGRINPAYKHHAIRILQFLTYSERPLRIDEAVDAVTVRLTNTPRFEPRYRLEDPKMIVCYCPGFAVLVEAYDQREKKHVIELQLAHLSVEEYFKSDKLETDVAGYFEEVAAAKTLTEICVSYLMTLRGPTLRRPLLEQYPFAQYAARYWSKFAFTVESCSDEVVEIVKNYYSAAAHEAFSMGSQISSPDHYYGCSSSDTVTPLYYASLSGLLNSVKLILALGLDSDIDQIQGYYACALMAAAERKHLAIATALLSRGANANSRYRGDKTPLSVAVSNNDIAMVELLIDHRANVNHRACDGVVPLVHAVELGSIAIVSLLLQNGADANASDAKAFSILSVATGAGHTKIVQALLNHGAKIDNGSFAAAVAHKQNDFLQLLLDKAAADETARSGLWSALRSASYHGHEDMVQKLLDHGADVNLQGYYIGSVLMDAARGGNESIFQMLLAHGATLMWSHRTFESELAATVQGGHAKMVQLVLEHAAEGINQRKISLDVALYDACYRGFERIVDILLGFGANANAFLHLFYVLEIASQRGNINIMKKLLNAGADPNKGEFSCAPIYFATQAGNEAAVQLLLDRGADINALTRGYKSCAIQCAVNMGNLTMVRYLVQNGANVNLQRGFYGSCLQIASAQGHHEMVEYLVQKGADVNIQGGSYGDALQAAASYGCHRVVHYLVANGAEVNAEGGRYGSALEAASAKGHREVVQCLLNNNANANIQAGKHGGALLASSREGHAEIVQLLLQKEANLEAVNSRGQTALSVASIFGHLHIVEILLLHGAERNTKDYFGRTPLFLVASSTGRQDIIRLLLDNGAEENTRDLYNSTPLMAAIRKGHVDAVQLLLAEKRLDKNATDYQGRSAMWWAKETNIQLVNVLVSYQLPDEEHVQNTKNPLVVDDAFCWCDICLREIIFPSVYRHCEVCADGMQLCVECFQSGFRCFNGIHNLLLYRGGEEERHI